MRVPQTISDFINRAEFAYPDRVAVVDEPGAVASLGRLSYAEVANRARGMAVALEQLGVGHGERVAIVSPNAARFFIVYFGVSAYGRVLVPVNYRLTAPEVDYIVQHSGASVVLIDPEFDEQLASVTANHRIVLDGVQDAQLFAGLSPGVQPQQWQADEEAIASINYTSGTTARPKGVQLTHRNCWTNAVIFGWHATVTPNDTLLHTLPMFHCNGWGMPYATTGMGCKQVVLRQIDGETILTRIEDEGVTLLCGAPVVLAAIIEAAEKRRSAGRPVPGRDTVRIVVAGAPPPSKAIGQVESELGWEFIHLYGLTETSPLLTMNRASVEYDGLSAEGKSRALSRQGLPAIGVEVKVDEEGEVLARSNVVFDGYWNQSEETDKAIVEGWFHTGDGGWLDGPHLVLSDRKKDVIITGGENVSSIEIEDVIYQHPAVSEVAVIGIPDDKWGETVKAIVVLREDEKATEQDIIDFVRGRIAHFKCPTSVTFQDVLPRTATGKLQKFKLRQQYWQGEDRPIH